MAIKRIRKFPNIPHLDSELDWIAKNAGSGEKGEKGDTGATGAQGVQGVPGIDGADGQGIDHVSFTSTTGSGQGEAGETDTYTVWGDAEETINLGTFEVYNGADGGGGGSGDMAKAVYDTNDDGRVDKAEAVDDGINVKTAAEIKTHIDTVSGNPHNVQASEISTNTSNFNKNLSSADDTVQKALETLDKLVIGGSMPLLTALGVGSYSLTTLGFNTASIILAG